MGAIQNIIEATLGLKWVSNSMVEFYNIKTEEIDEHETAFKFDIVVINRTA